MAQIIRIKYEINDKDVEQAQKEFKKTAKAAGATDKEIEQINKEIKKMPANAKKAQKGIGGIGGSLKGLAGPLAAAFAVSQIADFGKELVTTAISLEALSSKASTVFGPALGIVEEQAGKLAGEMGLTNQEFVNAAAAIGDLLVPMGFTKDEAAGLSSDLVGLSGALSEWTGGQIDATEVSDILAKAMLGEREQLKTLGIAISEADVQSKLLEKGQKGLTGAALQQAKAQATLELVYAKSTDAQASFEAGGGSLVRTQAKIGAWLENIKETLAKALIPALHWAIDAFGVFRKAMTPLTDALISVWARVFELGSVLNTAIGQIFGLGDGFNILKSILNVVKGVLIDWYGTLETGLEAGIKSVRRFSATFAAIKVVLKELGTDFSNFFGAVGNVFDGGLKNIGKNASKIKDTFSDIGAGTAEDFWRAYDAAIAEFDPAEPVEEIVQKEKPAFKKVGEDAGKTLGDGIKKGIKEGLSSGVIDAMNDADEIPTIPVNIEPTIPDVTAPLIDDAQIDATEEKIKEMLNRIKEEGSLLEKATVELFKVFGKEITEGLDEDIAETVAKVEGIISGLAGTLDGIFALQDVNNENRLKALDKERDTALANAEFEGKNKIAIEHRFQKEREKLEKAQFARDKRRAVADVLIKAAQASIAALSLGPFAAIAQLAFIGIQSGLSIAAINAQQFADGVINLKGPGTGTSDSIPARLSKGESVMTAKETAQFMPTLKAIRSNKVSPEVLNNLVLGKNGVSVVNNNSTAGATAPTPIINVDEYGISRYNRQAGDTHDRLNRKMDL